MELYIYSGFGELPSIDFDCLRTTTFIKFNNVPAKIQTDGNPFKSPNGFLPYLRCDDGALIAGYDEIISHFKSKGYGVEDAQDEYRNESYICYLNEQLGPYCEYVLWGDPANVDATRTLYAKRTPFPFNFSHPQKYMKRAQDLLQIYGAFNITEKLEHHHTADLVIKAKIFVNTLSERLTHREWFFDGTKPTQFDAAVYAKLAIMYNMQLQNNDLKSHINECPSLVKFMKAVRGKYLFDIKVNGGNGAEQKTITSRVKRVFVDSESGSLSNGTVKVIAGIVAISSMVIFALTHGILEIGTDDDSSATGQYTPYDDDDEYGDE